MAEYVVFSFLNLLVVVVRLAELLRSWVRGFSPLSATNSRRGSLTMFVIEKGATTAVVGAHMLSGNTCFIYERCVRFKNLLV